MRLRPCEDLVLQADPRMSSYITAIVAGPYEKVTSELTNSEGRVIPLGVYARKSLMPFVDAEGHV